MDHVQVLYYIQLNKNLEIQNDQTMHDNLHSLLIEYIHHEIKKVKIKKYQPLEVLIFLN